MGTRKAVKIQLTDSQNEELRQKAERGLALLLQINQRDKSFKLFESWFKAQYPDFEGLKGPGTNNLKNDLYRIDDLVFTDKSYPILVGKLDWVIDKAPQYLAESLLEACWYVYFHYSKRIGQEPQIGRGVLRLLSKARAEFINVEDGSSKDFSGTYVYHHKEAFFFDLEAASQSNTKLHIKMYWSDAKQELALGSYNTYENNHIVSGSLVFQRVYAADNAEPLLLSLRKNSKGLDDLPGAIKDFLSLRSTSYLKIPQEINSIELLAEEVRESHARARGAEAFIETKKPTVFIATPDSGYGKVNPRVGRMAKLIIALQKEFGELYQISHRNTVVSPEILKERLMPSETLKIIKQTRVFILVLPRTEKISFSSVQLGWAVVYCKYVYVFYEKGSLSERLMHLQQLDVTMIEMDTDFDERAILDKITDILTIDSNKIY